MKATDGMLGRVAQRPAAPWTIAVGAALLAVAARVALDPWLGPSQFAYVVLLPTIVVVAWRLGRGPALVATAVGGVATAWAVLEPRGSTQILSTSDAVGVAVYALIGVFCAWAGDAQRRARQTVDTSELAMRQSEQKVHELLANMPGGAGFIVDRELRYQMAAGDILTAAGVDPQRMIGKTVAEALGPERAPAYEARYRQALAGHSFTWEHEAHGRVIVSRGVPLRDASGAVYAALAFAHDVTEQRRAEAAVRIGRIGVFRYDPVAGRIELDARMRELIDEPPESAGLAFGRFLTRIHADDSDRVIAAVAAALDVDGAGVLDVDCRIVRRDGVERRLVLTGETEFAPAESGRRAVRMDGTARDITPRSGEPSAPPASIAMDGDR